MIKLDNKDKRFWSELGIDYEKLENTLASKSDKGRVLQNKIRGDTFDLIKSKYNLSENFVTHALRNLWATNEESFKDIYVLCNSTEKFNEDEVKKYYKRKFNDDSQRSILYMLIRSLLEDTEVIRQMHYATLLASKKLVSCIADRELTNVNFDNLSEEDAENYARQIHRYVSMQNTINVWYILRDENDISIFIYKNCKARAKIPDVVKRQHQFIKHSRPIILRFTNNANLVEVYGRSNEQAYRMASKISTNYISTPTSPISITYSQEEVLTSMESLSLLMQACMREETDCPFALIQLCCKPKEEFNDCDLTFIKNRDSLIDMTQKIEEALSTTISVDKINSVQLKFKERKFSLIFDQRDNNQILVSYSSFSPDISLNKEFKQTLLEKYDVKVVRRG